MSRLAYRSRIFNPIARFIQHEATAGFVLVVAAALALVASNTAGLSQLYTHVLSLPLTISIADLSLSKPLLLWINDGLMAIFFFLVGLEIKREALRGHLSSRDQVMLPALAAAGGMAAPAAVYIGIVHATGGDPSTFRGWAIPAATDIAFAMGALALLGSRIPLALKVFLLTLATLDDLGAIVIIAVFYVEHLSPQSLLLALGCCGLLFAMNRFGIERVAPYVFVGLAMWVFVLKSGVHATLSGVALAFAIPLHRRDGQPIIGRLEEGLHPYVIWLILPMFALANAGVSLQGFSLAMLFEPVPLGIALGLLVGKPVGIFLTTLLAVRGGLSRLPEGVGWAQMLGVAALGGIGFTMSLFIGMLAFHSGPHAADVRIGVIAGSVLSACLGYCILRFATAPRRAASPAR